MGSPPQVRGKLRCRSRSGHGGGITPAGAGKTMNILPLLHQVGDHPRRCGENVDMPTEARETLGSPPQVRGKRVQEDIQHLRHGITPAGAGKTPRQGLPTVRRRDHPRRCGENQGIALPLHCLRGSPPQVRGKLPVGAVQPHQPGITPAGAGKTGFAELTGDDAKDHPRRCGENPVIAYICSRVLGSPPQVRGKLKAISLRGRTHRITPAGAGKTQTGTPLGVFLRDHPRRCGENCKYIFAPIDRLGSPPQVRGKHNVRSHARRRIRITPAGAGKTGNCGCNSGCG